MVEEAAEELDPIPSSPPMTRFFSRNPIETTKPEEKNSSKRAHLFILLSPSHFPERLNRAPRCFSFLPDSPRPHTTGTGAHRIGSVLAPGPSSGRDNAWPITKDQWHAPASVVVVRGREDKGKAERAAERRNTVGPKHNNGGGDFFFFDLVTSGRSSSGKVNVRGQFFKRLHFYNLMLIHVIKAELFGHGLSVYM